MYKCYPYDVEWLKHRFFVLSRSLLHNGSERGKSEVATAAIMHHFCCDMMKQSKWPACHQNILAIPMSELKSK
jgi:hypothetical protein